MLVLGRKVEETVVIGGHIVVVVLSVEGNRVRLGIQAPRQVPIYRGELGPVVVQADRLGRTERPAQDREGIRQDRRGEGDRGEENGSRAGVRHEVAPDERSR
jgi:carbon storage regulator